MQSRQKEKELQKVKGVRDIVPDFDQWPESWMGIKKDLGYGKKLLPFMEKFIHSLMAQGLSRKILKEYVDWVWLLGGRIIKEVSIYKEYKRDPAQKLMDAVQGGGCLPEGHEGMSKGELESLARMCGQFEGFLKNIADSRQQ